MRKKILILIACITLCFFSGCSNAEVYMNANQEIINQLAEGEDVELEGPSLISPLKYLEWCNTMKMYAPIVIVVSILIGIFLVYIFKKDKPIQKVGIFLFIIGIPVIVIVVVYGTCYLYGKLF